MSSETFLDGRVTLHAGDCMEMLPTLGENSVDSCLTDPPYHLQSIVKRFAKTGRTDKTRTKSGPHQRTARGFMNKVWDGGDIAFRVETWQQVFRVLKPGAYLLAFSGTRTYHRMASAIEDAGFVVYDMVDWIYGQGFPKSVNIALEFETTLCERRAVTPERSEWFYISDGEPMRRVAPYRHPDANQWDGFGTALKPSKEPICLARKPLSEKTIAANVKRWGTGALNIGGCRVESDGGEPRSGEASQRRRYSANSSTNFAALPGPRGGSPEGRWPANIVHDGSAEVVAAFPDAPGQQYYVGPEHGDRLSRGIYGDFGPRPPNEPSDDGGSAARFFYTAKADSDDRLGSKHPTVKPLDLIQYMARLVTPPKGLVLDLFAGTGTTGEAAWREGFNAVLIEREAEYQDDIRRRMALCLAGPDERAREAIKARTKDKPVDAGPLFGGS